jgi:hypothetical protein
LPERYLLSPPAAVYQLNSPAVVLSGAVLMQAGLTIKFFSLDDSVMFLLASERSGG